MADCENRMQRNNKIYVLGLLIALFCTGCGRADRETAYERLQNGDFSVVAGGMDEADFARMHERIAQAGEQGEELWRLFDVNGDGAEELLWFDPYYESAPDDPMRRVTAAFGMTDEGCMCIYRHTGQMTDFLFCGSRGLVQTYSVTGLADYYSFGEVLFDQDFEMTYGKRLFLTVWQEWAVEEYRKDYPDEAVEAGVIFETAEGSAADNRQEITEAEWREALYEMTGHSLEELYGFAVYGEEF